MPPSNEIKIPTTAGMETATETVNRIQSARNVAPPTDIPVAAVENNAPPALNVPEPTMPTVNTEGVVAGADQAVQSLQEQEAQRKEAEVTQAQTEVSANEQAIRDAAGVLGTEAEKRTELETAAGVPEAQKQLRELATGLSMASNNLREFDLNFVNSIEQMRVGASKKDLTKRTFSAANAEANVQMAVQRAGMVSSIYSQQASIQILQDNVKGATEAIDKALTSFYEPIRQEMEMETMFYQRNSQLFDSAQNRAANARLASIEQQQNVIDQAVEAVDTAVVSGYASAEDIERMTSLSGQPDLQKKEAQKIIARGRAAKIAQENALFNAQMAKLRQDLAASGQTGTTQEAVQIQSTKNQDLLKHARLVSQNEAGLRALTAGGLGYQAGQLVKSVTTTAFGGAIAGGAVGSVVPGAGTVAGGAVGFLGGTAAGAGMGLKANAEAKEDALASLNYLLQNASFQSLRDEKAAGLSFGALSNAERTAAGSAANAVAAALEIDVATGQPIGIKGSYDQFQENMTIVENALMTNQNRLVNGIIPPEIQAEIDATLEE